MLRYDEKRSEYFKCVINSIFTSFLNVKSNEEGKHIILRRKLMFQQRKKQKFFKKNGRKNSLNFMNKINIFSPLFPRTQSQS